MTTQLKQFKSKSTRKQRRLAIVEDILERLQEFKFVKCNGYIVGKNGKIKQILNHQNENNQLKNSVCDLKQHCQVCALGGLFLTAVDKYNHLLVKEVRNDYFYNYDAMSRTILIKKLQKYFSRQQLDMIEVAFERRSNYNTNVSNKMYDKVIMFNKRIRSPQERMKRILQNILDNDGIFKP